MICLLQSQEQLRSCGSGAHPRHRQGGAGEQRPARRHRLDQLLQRARQPGAFWRVSIFPQLLSFIYLNLAIFILIQTRRALVSRIEDAFF